MASHSFFLVTLCLVALAGHTAQCRRLSEVAAATAPAPAPVSSSLGANFYAAPAGSKCSLLSRCGPQQYLLPLQLTLAVTI
ncbi:hypothetical protein WJX72_010620 [[Myrmecia] bisecta]|uniref:Uncharacterized protein n=1 Tax=[Myrmecia] bisecta TaxID=41462 RepID=A0AAW1QA61_9CHLO